MTAFMGVNMKQHGSNYFIYSVSHPYFNKSNESRIFDTVNLIASDGDLGVCYTDWV